MIPKLAGNYTYSVSISRLPVTMSWLVLCVSALFVIATAGCGGGRSVVPTGAWRGTAGNALVVDKNGYNNTPPAELWVGFDSSADFNGVLGDPSYLIVSGNVVADPTQPLGFYLDPTSTSTTKIVTPEQVQAMRTVGQNVQYWAGQTIAFTVSVKQTN
jgi:hypothetical protein